MGNLSSLVRSGPPRGSGLAPSNQPRPLVAQPVAAPRLPLTEANSPTHPLGQSWRVSGGPARSAPDLSRSALHLEKGKQLMDNQQQRKRKRVVGTDNEEIDTQERGLMAEARRAECTDKLISINLDADNQGRVTDIGGHFGHLPICLCLPL